MHEAVRGNVFGKILLVTTLPALFVGIMFLGIFAETAFVSLIFFPLIFIVQILSYWLIGKAVWLVYSFTRKCFATIQGHKYE